ncbi:hypothetical protein EDB92DRAFT_2114994 [Lactarius akahatsu]|uniref:Uncharacterized protein n=1 Tax=Lactarius akahatsu TaxID=416441 RepID=A0AAD4LFT5_9AGAM|nr:hypothetical protein EDB92DRAFT_2114994 [Lactarius akahatsu]
MNRPREPPRPNFSVQPSTPPPCPSPDLGSDKDNAAPLRDSPITLTKFFNCTYTRYMAQLPHCPKAVSRDEREPVAHHETSETRTRRGPPNGVPSITLNTHAMTMATTFKPLTADRIEDVILGAFGNLRSSETLNHLIWYLSTWSGSDKLFMLIQYGAKVLIPILEARARLQHYAGMRSHPTSSIAPKLAKLATTICSARSLWGLWGMLPIIQWLIALERAPPPTRCLLTIERTQGWSMLSFFPLQQLSFLRTNDLVSAALHLPTPSGGRPRRVAIHDGAVSLWSTRLWMTYVVLQLAHLREDRALLVKRQRALEKLSVREKLQPQERAELARRWDAWYNELAVNLSYLPMTIHGSALSSPAFLSLEKGLFGNNIWISLFGFAAAIASFRSGWKATALPPPPLPPAEPSEDAPEVSDIALVTNDTDSSSQ